MDCIICSKPIVRVPSAAERAAKDVAGRPAAHYQALFTQRTADTLALMRRLK